MDSAALKKSAVHRHNQDKRHHRNKQTANQRNRPKRYALKKAAAFNGINHLLRQGSLLCRAKPCGIHNRRNRTLHDIEQGKH